MGENEKETIAKPVPDSFPADPGFMRAVGETAIRNLSLQTKGNVHCSRNILLNRAIKISVSMRTFRVVYFRSRRIVVELSRDKID
jgi:hypothetical protein